MAFVKLDTGILQSSLWIDRECREVFITALLMAEPYELREPAAQLEIESLRPTGFSVPPGWYGFVRAASVGIVHMAKVEVDAGLAAIERLGSPDRHSRSAEHEGRRLVRVNEGFILLNYLKYRDKDHKAAERQRRFRERNKVTPSRRDEPLLGRDVTHADADAENILKKKTAAFEYHKDFELAWAAYPKRSGDNPKKAAFECWNARLKEGIQPEAMVAGVKRYATFCQAEDKIGSVYVMQAKRFFGRELTFEQPWHYTKPPTTTPTRPTQPTISARDIFNDAR